jgi:hypothetical protein
MLPPMDIFKTRDLVIMGVASVVAIVLLYLMGQSWAYAIGWTALFAAIGLVSMYFKGRRSS